MVVDLFLNRCLKISYLSLESTIITEVKRIMGKYVMNGGSIVDVGGESSIFA